uniref:RNA-dependent RNA polymerase n=1 Tax=Plasmopara viticola lesion associated mitovirus 53 TaxID=2719482 RepID=A0A6G9RVD6_9VIRU|nr:RNA-dependent RNA polymerase [Plasmopara viticola lesion associated mitovirus 53]
MTLKVLLSIISIYRVFPTKPKVKLDTITDLKKPGSLEVLPSDEVKNAVLEVIPKGRLIVNKSYLTGGERASPNSKKAIWGTSADACAFAHYPNQLFNLIKYNGLVNLRWTLYLFITLAASLPIYAINLWLFNGKKAVMGRLSVVYDQAGKARVVAITNWWLQQSLKPLHDSIFRILKSIPEDGTFDQRKPITALIGRVKPSQVLYGFDLSAATDRLPISLQVQILNCLQFDGNAWMKNITIPWTYRSRTIFYSVGQPMGAYSSWGMLALTHHILVMISAHRAKIIGFRDYCILGDDVVIANDAVAQEYLKLMESLGVDINLSKSVISNRFTEFAKTWVGKGVNLSPLGPGLILQALRHRFFIPKLFLEAIDMRLIPLSEPLKFLEKLPKSIMTGKSIQIILGSLLMRKIYTKLTILPENKFSLYNFFINDNHLELLLNRCITIIKADLDRSWTEMRTSITHLLKRGWRTSTTRLGPFFYLSDMVWFLLKPGFWYYLFSFNKSLKDYMSKVLFIEELCKESLDRNDQHSKCIRSLGVLSKNIDILSIDWKSKEDVRISYNKMNDIIDSLPPVRAERTSNVQYMLYNWL